MSDQAMKLFEALSGVDEELLERCDQKVNRKNTTVYNLFGKYGRTMAACICLIVVGVAAWSGYRFVTGPCGSDASGQNGSPAEAADMGGSILTADGGSNGESGKVFSDSEMLGNDATAAGGTAGNGEITESEVNGNPAEASAAAVEAATPEAQQEPAQNMQAMTADKAGSMSSSGEDRDLHTESVSERDNTAEKMEEMRRLESQIADSRSAVPWEEAIALDPFAGYLPTVLPAGYEPLSARRSTFPDLWNNVIYKWSEGEHIFSLDMTLGEVMTREDMEKRDGINEFLAEEFQKEWIPEPLDGQIRFTLYYADGMEIGFAGYVTADEMWEVVEAVSR